LSEIIAQAIDLARTSIEGRSSLGGASIKILCQVPEQLPAVRGPASDVRQVFLNLLLNAADALHREGEIKIDSTVQDAAVEVRVSDNGSGIPLQHMQRIFEPFFTTKGPRGSGLGLSTARDIMERIGGSISAANREERGAVLILRFPRAHPRAEMCNAQAADMGGGCRFLLVDDNAGNLDSLREILAHDGHNVDTAVSGAEAIEKLSRDPNYDIVLCDLEMPEVNGWGVAAKASQIRAETDVYIVTGWGLEIEGQIPPSVAVAGVLTKPIDLNQLRRIAAARASVPRHVSEAANSPGLGKADLEARGR